MLWELDMPWVRPPLNLNDRMHWAAKARLTAEIRRDAGLIMRSAKIPPLSYATVGLDWIVPDQRRRDTDNPVLTLKPCADAMVDVGILVDDTPEFVSKRETRILYLPKQRAVRLVIIGEPCSSTSPHTLSASLSSASSSQP